MSSNDFNNVQIICLNNEGLPTQGQSKVTSLLLKIRSDEIYQLKVDETNEFPAVSRLTQKVEEVVKELKEQLIEKQKTLRLASGGKIEPIPCEQLQVLARTLVKNLYRNSLVSYNKLEYNGCDTCTFKRTSISSTVHFDVLLSESSHRCQFVYIEAG
jgi:hypothetical protein